MSKFILILSFIITLSSLAHEGHHHGPSAVTPPKGGMINSLETVHLEMLQQGEMVKIYIYNKDLKPVAAKDYPVSATATRPRQKTEDVKLITQKNHWEFNYDSKGAHRYKLVLTIEQGGHKDKVHWNIEPKKKY